MFSLSTLFQVILDIIEKDTTGTVLPAVSTAVSAIAADPTKQNALAQGQGVLNAVAPTIETGIVSEFQSLLDKGFADLEALAKKI